MLHRDDTPGRIALSVAIGMFVAWLPLLGAQMAVALALCWLTGANKRIGVPLVWISNPFTVIPLYYPSYRLGLALLGGVEKLSPAPWRTMAAEVFGADASPPQRLAGFWSFAMDIAGPLWLGSLLAGGAVAGGMYWITYLCVNRYRREAATPPVEAAPVGP